MKRQWPNILHIIVHDLGRHLGCYRRTDVPSPNLDRLAANGIRFENCFTASPPCSPARACLMTGRYAHSNAEIGLVNLGFDLPEEERTIVDYLNDAGYLTANIGLQHERSNPLANRYQHDDHQSGACEVVATKAADFLKRQAKPREQPFYLNVGFFEVHLPFGRPEYVPGDPARVTVPKWLPDNSGVREELARFHGAISSMDAAVGVILDSLSEAGLDEETLVIFTTDHGMAFPRAKGTLYDPGIGVALIIRMPSETGPTGAVVDDLISSIDVAPTLLDATGSPLPETIQGRSFLPLLTGESHQTADCIFSEKNYHDCYDPIRCVRTARHKYIRNFEPRPKIILAADIKRSSSSREMWPWADQPREPEEIYDLQADPWEMTNLIGDPALASVRTELSERLDVWMRETGDPLLRGPVPAPTGAVVAPPDLPHPSQSR